MRYTNPRLLYYFTSCFISLTGYRYLGDGGTDRHEILHDDTYRSRTESPPPIGAVPLGSLKSQILGLNFGHSTANISQTVSRSYMSV